MMRVCMLLKRGPDDFRKDSRVIREAYALKCAGYHVTVALYGSQGGSTVYNGINVAFAHVKDIRHFEKYNCYSGNSSYYKRNIIQKIINKAIKIIYDIRYHKSLYRTAARENADIYHCHDFETLYTGWRVSKKNSAKLIYDSHELWMESVRYTNLIDRILKNLFLVNVERLLIKKAHACITVCSSISRHLSRKYGIDMPYVLRNLPERIKYGPFSDHFREEFKIAQYKRIVLYQGGLVKGRGLFKLVDAWKLVDSRIVLVIMGYGPLYNDIKNRIEQHGLMGRIFLKEAVDPSVLLDYTRCADAGICPIENISLSYYYSSPNKMWEYAAAGIPVLASSFPEMGEFLLREGMGLSFDPENSADMASKINGLFDDSNVLKYNSMKQSCIEKSDKLYNWDKEKHILIDIYRSL